LKLFIIIYKTTNLINGKIYIGKDSHNNPNYIGSGKLIKYAIKKYGKENFTKEILEYCNTDNIDEREIYWIKEFNSMNNGYNISSGGQGGDPFKYNRNMKNISEKMSNSHKGDKNSMYGKSHSDSSKIKMRNKKIGKYIGDKNPRSRKLYQYDSELNLIKIWDFCKDCADNLSISRGNLSSFAKHNSDKPIRYKKLKEFIFSFSNI
jgi:group I intron endonuclease